MAGQLLPFSLAQWSDVDGEPLALAEMHFYLAGTTTPEEVFEDSLLAVSHGTSVVADAQGIFPPVYFDPEVPLRMKVIEAGGDVNNPLMDCDPCSVTLLITAGQIDDGAIEAKLGYTPVDPDADVTFTEYVRITKVLATADGSEVGFRSLPLAIHNANYTLAFDDIGKGMRKDDTGTYTWTIPLTATVALPVGSLMHYHNGNSGVLTIDKEVGITLTALGDTSFTNLSSVTIQPGEWGFLWKTGTNTWQIYKAGLFPSYTISTLPATGTAGQQVYVSNLGGGAGLVAWDATASKWIRVRTEGYDVDNTNANATWTPLTSAPTVRHTGTLTADRTITLSTTNAYAGLRARYTRTGSGAFNLSIGGLKNLIQNTWCEVTYDGSGWFLSAYGAL